MNVYQRYLLEEFAEEYRGRRMSRRDLLRRAVLVTGSIPAAAAVLTALGCGGDDAPSDQTAPSADTSPGATQSPAPGAAATPTARATVSTPAINTADLRFKGPASDLLGYIAGPGGAVSSAGVLVVHENRGLVEHTRDVTRRLAAEGFTALAVDLVSRAGGSKVDTAQNTGALGRAKIEDLIGDLQAYIAHLNAVPGVRPGGVGVTGFCFGGGYTFEAAIASAEVKAAVPFYGICRLIDDLPKTKAAVMALYGANDTRVTSQADQVRAKLQASGQPFDVRVYPGANHAFFNDTSGSYNADAAADAWNRTLAWFRTYLPA